MLLQAGVDSAIGNHIAQRCNVKIGVANERSPQAALLRDMYGFNRGVLVGPAVQLFQKDPAAVVEGQHAGVLRRIMHDRVICLEQATVGLIPGSLSRAQASASPTGPAPMIAISKSTFSISLFYPFA